MSNRTVDRALAAPYAVKVDVIGMWDSDERAIDTAIDVLQRYRKKKP